jgi:hypothetical protein
MASFFSVSFMCLVASLQEKLEGIFLEMRRKFWCAFLLATFPLVRGQNSPLSPGPELWCQILVQSLCLKMETARFSIMSANQPTTMYCHHPWMDLENCLMYAAEFELSCTGFIIICFPCTLDIWIPPLAGRLFHQRICDQFLDQYKWNLVKVVKTTWTLYRMAEVLVVQMLS